MRNDYTHLSFILDNSGSMQPIKNDTMGAFNSFLDKQKKESGKMTFSLYNFNSMINVSLDFYHKKYSQESMKIIYEMKDISEVENLTDENYSCITNTPLLDVIGSAIEKTGNKLAGMSEEERPAKVLFVILTDGEENASVEYTRASIFDKIKHQREKYKWEFVFLGANQDAIAEASKIGILTRSAMTYNTAKMNNTMDALSCTVSAYRSVGGTSVTFTDESRKEVI